jgi:hypothetical protein
LVRCPGNKALKHSMERLEAYLSTGDISEEMGGECPHTL